MMLSSGPERYVSPAPPPFAAAPRSAKAYRHEDLQETAQIIGEQEDGGAADSSRSLPLGFPAFLVSCLNLQLSARKWDSIAK